MKFRRFRWAADLYYRPSNFSERKRRIYMEAYNSRPFRAWCKRQLQIKLQIKG